jgi:hypothetical protein
VVGPCLSASRLGYTPNPDALCNARVKFLVIDAAMDELDKHSSQSGNSRGGSGSSGNDGDGRDAGGWGSRYAFIASGHYARRYPAALPQPPSTSSDSATTTTTAYSTSSHSSPPSAAPPRSPQESSAASPSRESQPAGGTLVPDIASKPYLNETEERAVRNAALELWGYDYGGSDDDENKGSGIGLPVLLLESVDPFKDQVLIRICAPDGCACTV